MLHHMFCILLGGRLHLAPLDHPQRILDIGTGTGIWALDIAGEFPSAEVIGTDLSAIQPLWVLPNVQFIVEDAEAEWAYAENSFDYIHSRCMLGSIRDWDKLLQQAFSCLRPGGYIELAEFRFFNVTSDDNTYTDKSSLWKYYELVNKASAKRGYPLTLDVSFIDLLSKTGFEGIECTPLKLATGTWPADPRQKELGRWLQVISKTGFEAYGLALLSRELGMNPADIRELVDKAKQDLGNKKIHAYSIV
jgi:SAM-dependent methyltransferase